MKATLFWASTALAQGLRQATGTPGGPESTPVPWYPEPEEEVSECTANLVAELCEYKDPLYGTAVAASGPKMCWEFCNEHKPCNFVIFVAGNPYTGSGNCYVYPGEDFDPALGKEGCDLMSVYDKPVCPQPTPTGTAPVVACAATESPSAIAEVCDYPVPEACGSTDCIASSGAVHCLSLCAERDQCAYAVFTAGNEMGSPYYSGGCGVYMYSEGPFDKSKAGECKGKPDQFVYKNPCPKPPKPTTSTSSASATSTSGSGSSSGGGPDKDNEEEEEEESSGDPATNAEAQGATKGGGNANNNNSGSATLAVSFGSLLTAALAAFIW